MSVNAIFVLEPLEAAVDGISVSSFPSLCLLQLMQNLGKADRTTDDIFEEHLANFNQQQVNANRLHKDISSYIRCVKGT